MLGISSDTIKYIIISIVVLYTSVLSFMYISLHSNYTETLYKLQVVKQNEQKLLETIKSQNEQVESMNADIVLTNKQLDIYAQELMKLYTDKNFINQNVNSINKVCGIEKQFIKQIHDNLITFSNLQRNNNDK